MYTCKRTVHCLTSMKYFEIALFLWCVMLKMIPYKPNCTRKYKKVRKWTLKWKECSENSDCKSNSSSTWNNNEWFIDGYIFRSFVGWFVGISLIRVSRQWYINLFLVNLVLAGSPRLGHDLAAPHATWSTTPRSRRLRLYHNSRRRFGNYIQYL